MRETLFQLLLTALRALPKFKHASGVSTVYDYPITTPDGYPYVIVVSESLESDIYDTARDLRLYNFLISVIGEKFGDTGGLSQSNALRAMRATEDVITSMLDGNNRLGGSGAGVIWVKPLKSKYGYTDGNSRVVLELTVQFQVAVEITLGS